MSHYVINFEDITKRINTFDNAKWPGFYSKEIEKPKRNDETGIYTAVNLCGEVILNTKLLPESIITCFDILEYAMTKWPDYPFLGYRKAEVGLNGTVKLGEYLWYSYKDVHRMTVIFGSALLSYDGGIEDTVIDDCDYVKSAKFVGILAKNSPKWLIIDYACSGYKLVSVPLYETLGIQSILHIANQTKMKILCTDSSKLQLIYENQEHLIHLKLIITLDDISKDDENCVKKLKFKVITFDTLIKMYEHKMSDPFRSTPKDLATIVYTSGTTGVPKGAVFTHETFVDHLKRYLSVGNRLKLHMGVRTLSFLPLAHVYQRFIEHAIVSFRCQIGYFSGDVKSLMGDIYALKPTFLVGVPRIFNKIHDKISKGISEKSHFAQFLVKKAIEIRAKSFRERICPIKLFFANIILSRITNLFGGKLITMVTGSAPLSSKVSFEIQGMLGAILTEGWGMTENGFTIVRDCMDKDHTVIGGPLGMIQFKLRSLPELNYLVTDNPPRGELFVRGNGIFKCYFRNKVLSAETIDSECWMSTGDVVEITATKAIRIIDRAKSIFKLSQGEYIAPDKLENIYSTVDMVEQIYVHGQPDKSFLVAIIVMLPERLEKWMNENKEKNKAKLDELLETHLLDQLDQVAKSNYFNPLERIKRAYITTEPFTIDNGLITPTFKNIRKNIAMYYKTQIEDMYRSQENYLSTIKF